MRSKDLGIDYICQWVYGAKPTPILYAVQVKTFALDVSEPKYMGMERAGFNQLKKYKISNRNLRVDSNTLAYWATLGMPVYLFAICDREGSLDCYYKRFTPVITQDKHDRFGMPFYQANEGSKFLAFADDAKRIGGFARDLFVDYIRCCYAKGLISYVNPRSIGLGQFPDQEYTIFKDLFEIYENNIRRVYQQTKGFLERWKGGQV